VVAMLNYTSGLEGLRAACTAANVRTLITSRTFLEKAKLQGLVDALEGVKKFYLEDARGNIRWQDKCMIMVRQWMPGVSLVHQDVNAPSGRFVYLRFGRALRRG